MRDWSKTLRRASFRGVPFWVEGEGPEVGRRVAVHEISASETVLTEDMGARARTVYVDAYVVGDLSDLAGHALEAACAAPGASRLVLPMDAGITAHCTACVRDRQKDRLGFVGYRLEFVGGSGGASFAASGLGLLRTTFAAGIAAAAAQLARLI